MLKNSPRCVFSGGVERFFIAQRYHYSITSHQDFWHRALPRYRSVCTGPYRRCSPSDMGTSFRTRRAVNCLQRASWCLGPPPFVFPSSPSSLSSRRTGTTGHRRTKKTVRTTNPWWVISLGDVEIFSKLTWADGRVGKTTCCGYRGRHGGVVQCLRWANFKIVKLQKTLKFSIIRTKCMLYTIRIQTEMR